MSDDGTTRQAVDGAMRKAPFGYAATAANPTDRGKLGVKRSLLTDGDGIPLALIIQGANRHDRKRLCATLDGIVVVRPDPTAEDSQHLCLDAGYGSPVCREQGEARLSWGIDEWVPTGNYFLCKKEKILYSAVNRNCNLAQILAERGFAISLLKASLLF